MVTTDQISYVIMQNTKMTGHLEYFLTLLIKAYNKEENYILTQSPLKETAVDLWRLVDDYNSSTIVMLNQIPTDQV